MTTKEKKSKKGADELKVVIRKLPPNLTEEIFLKSIHPFKDTIYMTYFVQGKNKYRIHFKINSLREKFAKYGRGYVIFNTQADKENFMKVYKPIFVDEKGLKIFNDLFQGINIQQSWKWPFISLIWLLLFQDLIQMKILTWNVSLIP
jgi:hypothetical protein